MAINMTRHLAWMALAVGAAGLVTVSTVSAQIPWPPATVFGSVTDDAGPVPEKVRVEAYIGEVLCGEGETGYTGEGDSRVTVYFADVLSEQQLEGCGKSGAEVRLKVGDRFASQTFLWEPGAIQVDITFGSATPAPIPTFTPTPAHTPSAGAPTEGSGATGGAIRTIPAGSPGAGSPIATRPGGLQSADPQASDASGDGDGGFPIWAVAILVFGGVAAVGGGVGYVMSRNRNLDDDPFLPRNTD